MLASQVLSFGLGCPPQTSQAKAGMQRIPFVSEMLLLGVWILYTTTAEGKNAMETLTPSPAPVVCETSGPMGGGCVYTTAAEAENSAVDASTTTEKKHHSSESFMCMKKLARGAKLASEKPLYKHCMRFLPLFQQSLGKGEYLDRPSTCAAYFRNNMCSSWWASLVDVHTLPTKSHTLHSSFVCHTSRYF